MSITSEIIFSVRDSSGNALLQFPDKSVLLNIIPDLLSNIIKYLGNHLFAIGEFYALYDNYRLVKNEDLENDELKNLFAYLYRLNIGVLNLMDNPDYCRGFPVYCENHCQNACLLSFNEIYVHALPGNNKMITLHARDIDVKMLLNNIAKIKIIYNWKHGTKNIGLFIRKDYAVKNKILKPTNQS